MNENPASVLSSWPPRLPVHCRLDSDTRDRDQLGVLRIDGPEASKFLQGQLTCDVLALPVGGQTLGASCTPQGRMRALFRLLRRDDHFLALMPRAVVATTCEALKKYAVFFKTTLHDASADYQLWGVLGADSATLPADALTLSAVHEVSRHLLVQAADARPPELPGGRADSVWAWAEVMAGEPAVYPETVEKLLPHHVNLPGVGGVSFSKGCYTGQEIIARMEYRAKIKTHLQRAVAPVTDPIVPGTAVKSGDNAVGEVVRSAQGGDRCWLLLTLADPAAEQSLQLALPEAPILELIRQ